MATSDTHLTPPPTPTLTPPPHPHLPGLHFPRVVAMTKAGPTKRV